ncbi:MAG TPA: DUF1993 family protein [Polyangiaceae bacterium]|jgi:hypothetical protein|nr:DUF1993 family protein [Polyangiaceae bacterium]
MYHAHFGQMLLRHNGVNLGKRDYLGSLTFNS